MPPKSPTTVSKPFDSLFSPSKYPNIAQSGQFTLSPTITTGDRLPRKSPDNPRDGIASTPIMEGIMAFVLGGVVYFGYVGTNHDEFMVVWEAADQGSKKSTIFGRFNLKTRVVEVSDIKFMGQAIGLLGMGAAYAQGNRTFKEVWGAFLTEVANSQVAAITTDSIGCISDICYGAIRYGNVWPADPASKSLLPDVTVKEAPELTKVVLDPNQSLRNAVSYPDDFEIFMQVEEDALGEKRTRFIGEQLDQVIRFVGRRKHLALLGPAGTGKTVSAFEALAVLGFKTKGVDYELFTCHEEVKASDLLGAWQPDGMGGFIWVDGPLTRAMKGNGGLGKPILVEEFTRMPVKSQNIFISALSDGYVTLNEKPSTAGEGEVVLAGKDFVFLGDMNVDPSVDDIDTFGQAFASRVRKIEFDYPKTDLLQRIARSETGCSTEVAKAASRVYDFAMKKLAAHDITTPISPRAVVFWIEDYLAEVEQGSMHREAAQRAAKHTWLRDVAGNDQALRQTLLSEVESAFRPIDIRVSGKAAKAP